MSEFELLGRSGIQDMVRIHAERANPGPTSARRPVLVLEGGPGSGKTATLRGIQNEYDEANIPHAFIDLQAAGEQPDKNSVRRLLADCASQLYQHRREYGRISLPLSVIAFKVLTLSLPADDPRAAQRLLNRELRRMRGSDAAAAFLREVASGGATAAGVPASSGLLEYLLVRPVVFVIWSSARRVVPLVRRQNWYGSREAIGREGRSIDTLCTLSVRAGRAANNEEDRAWVDTLLWRAFLADLEYDFARRRSRRRRADAVLLLDNAHTAPGQWLMHKVVIPADLRAGHPLTVVAAADPGLLGRTLHSKIIQYGPGPDARASTTWARHPLANLTGDEVTELVEQVAPGLAAIERLLLADELFQFTQGHPAATRLLLDSVLTPTDGRIELVEALRQPHRDGTVEGWLLDLLLGGSMVERRAWEICAAGWNHSDAELLAGSELIGRRVSLPTGPDVWPTIGGAAGPTLARSLLLGQLALRPHWGLAYQQIHRFVARPDHPTDAELYYRLAGGDETAAVAWQLTAALRGAPARSWVDRLTRIGRAPRQRPRPVTDLRSDPMPDLAVGEDDTDIVRALLDLLSIAANPLCGSRRGSLYTRLELWLTALKKHVDDSGGELQRRVDQYGELAVRWTR